MCKYLNSEQEEDRIKKKRSGDNAIICTVVLFEKDFNYSELLNVEKKKAFTHSSENVTHSALTMSHLLFSNLPLTTNQGLNCLPIQPP